MWAEKLKLNKQLIKSATEAGYLTPKEIQAATLSRISGGQDIIAIAPEGAGKTTTYVLGILAKIKYGLEEAPRALVLVPDKDSVLSVVEQFNLLNKNKSIRILGLYSGPSIEVQVEEVTDGADILVATPDRARAIYLKLGLNVNKIITLVIDDAERIVKQGLQLPVVELANSIGSCQHLVFSEVFHERIEKMIDPFMRDPAYIELDELEETDFKTVQQVFYHVPNFKTKLNLLQLLLDDEEVFVKAIVFVNTRLTAEKVYQHLKNRSNDYAVLSPLSFDTPGYQSFEEFLENDARVLIVANELKAEFDITGMPFILHAEMPDEKETYLNRILNNNEEEENDTIALSLVNDLELATVKKIEQVTGQKAEFSPLPENLIIYQEQSTTKPKTKAKQEEPERGEAFHQKKQSNSKDYNYGGGAKAKMTKKKKHQ